MSDRRAYLLVNLATLIWASNITLGRALRADIGPATLTFVRVVIAALILTVALRREINRHFFRGWPLLVAMGATGIAGFPVLLYWSVRYTTAVNAGLITAITPLVTLPIAAWWLGDRVWPRQVVGMVLSLVGVGLIVGVNAVRLGVNIGDLLSIIDALVWAVYSVLGRLVMRQRTTLPATGAAFLLSIPLLVPLVGVEAVTLPTTWTPPLALLALYIGIFPGAIALLCWNGGVHHLGPGRAMAFYNTLPLYTALLAVAALGEPFQWTHLVGGALVVGGGLFAARGTAFTPSPSGRGPG